MKRIALAIDAQHPAFAGHFPGFPLFPGAALLDLALQAIQAATGTELRGWQIANAKFMDMVRPGDQPSVEFEAPNPTLIRFVVQVGDRQVASGTLAKTALPLS